MYTRYRHASSTKKIINLLGKKNTRKKTSKENSELGYSDFTLALTFHLPHPQQKDMHLSPMHKKIQIEANLGRKDPTISTDSCDYDGPSSMSIVGHLRKKMETLWRGVSDRHDGYAGRTVEGMMIRRRCPSKDTWKKYGDP